MGRLIIVVGNSGVGKTTLTRALCRIAPLVTGLEAHEERPFQRLFSEKHKRYALANQLDYLLLRAEQEAFIRGRSSDGVQDGGLDLDYYVFTRYFYQLGYLEHAEFQLCRRTYFMLRDFMGPPDVIVCLQAPLEVILDRFATRNRGLEIATLEDLEAMQALLDEWLNQVRSIPIIRVDASQDDPEYSQIGEQTLKRIFQVLD